MTEALTAAKPDLVVVDDDQLTLDLLEMKLSGSGLAVRFFDDCDDAIEFLKDCTPGALFVDLRMPLMSGIELLQALVGSGAGLPERTFIASAADLPQDAANAAEVLGAGVLLKDTYRDAEAIGALVRAA